MDHTESKLPASRSGGIDSGTTREVASGSTGGVADSADEQSEGFETGQNSEKPENLPREYGGRKGPEPTRYGDWEKNGRCIDF